MSKANDLIAPEALPQKGITIGERQRRRLEKAGKFPKRVHVTTKTHAYLAAEIEAWIVERVHAREAVAA